MSEKVASVKLTLNGSTFLASLKQLGTEGEKEAKKVESAWKQVGAAGFSAMKRSASETIGSIKTTLKMVAGLGGGLSLVGAVKGALDSQLAFKGLAFDIEEASGQTVDFREVMRTAQAEASKWGKSQTELAAVFKDVQSETKDLDFSTEAMKASGMVSRATGDSLQTLGEIAGKLGSKFDVTDGDIADGLSVVHSMSRQAHIPLEEMATVIDRIGSSGKSLGIQGVSGFERIMGLATIAKDSTKGMRGALQATMQLMEQMGDASHRKKMMVAFGVDTKGKDWEQGLTEIIKKTGGKRELLAKGFEGEQLKVVVALGEVFRSTFEGATGTAKDKTKAALDALKAHLTEAGTANVNAARMNEKAAERMQSPSAQMEKAMEDLKTAFTKPEIIAAMMRLAKVAPEAANKLAHLAELVFDHPAMAAGIFAGIKLGVPLLQGAMTAGGKIIAQQVAAGVASALLGKGGGVGSSVGGGAGFLGRAGMVAGAGLAGVAIGEAVTPWINSKVDESGGKANSLKDAMLAAELNANTGAAGSSDRNLKARLADAKKDREFSWKDVASVGLRRIGTASDKDIAAAEKLVAERAAKTAEAFAKAGDALDRFGRRLDGVDKPGQGTGVRTPEPVRPGYAPR